VDSKRILIVGANGQLGKALHARYPGAIAVDRDTFDMSNWQAVQAFDWSRVDTILNAAAYAKVDEAETAEGRIQAWQANAVGPANLAKIATQHQLTLVHVSSDYVFDGRADPHAENEPFSPLNVYGQSKAAGDIAVGVAPQHYILRITWLIGDGPNFVRTMLALAAKNTKPTVVNDQIGRLTFTQTVVEAVDHLLTTQATFGTYNISNGGEPASWAEIARVIFGDLHRQDVQLTETSTAHYFADKPAIAPRPLHSVLDLTKITQSGLVLRDWRDDLRDYIAHEQSVSAGSK